MNTSEPCSTCTHLLYGGWYKDDPTYTARCSHDCAINTGEREPVSWCSWYAPWDGSNGRREQPSTEKGAA